MKRGRTFGGVEHAQTAASPGSYIKKTPAGSHPIHNPIYGFGNLGDLGRDRAGDLLIFLINDGKDISRRQSVNMGRCRILLLGQQTV